MYLLISAEFIITVLIDGDTFEYVHFLRERGRLSGIDWEKKKNPLQPPPSLFFWKLGIRGTWRYYQTKIRSARNFLQI